MKKRNKTYMLFLYGVWSDENEMIRMLRDILLPVVDSGYLKFVHGPASGIASFKSQEDFEDISEYLEEHLPNFVTNYIFMPKPRKMNYRFPMDMDKHLFDTDTNTNDLVDKQINYEISLEESIDESFFGGFEDINEIIGRIDEMFSEFVTDVKNYTNNKKMELDDILDKITEKGVSSLTEEEREFLDNQNKKN